MQPAPLQLLSSTGEEQGTPGTPEGKDRSFEVALCRLRPFPTTIKKERKAPNPEVRSAWECSLCDLQGADIPPEPGGDVNLVMFSWGSLIKIFSCHNKRCS